MKDEELRMSISLIMRISSSGMQAQHVRLGSIGNNIANVQTPGYNRLETKLSSLDTGGVTASVVPSGQQTLENAANVDLSCEMISLFESEMAFKANTAVWETGADIWDVLLSIKRG